MSVANKAQIIAVLGSSGSGKSLYIKQSLKNSKPKRLIIIDPMDEYMEFARPCQTLAELINFLKNDKFAVRYVPKAGNLEKPFGLICKAAYHVGDCTLVVDELSLFTKPTSAPPEWSNCSMRGRHKLMTIYGSSQRPANLDKNFFSNATLIRSGRMNYQDDVRVVANVLNVPAQYITDLKPLEYIQRDMATGIVNSGNIKI